MSDRSHLDWPFFERRHRDLAARLWPWVEPELGAFATTANFEGRPARTIFERLGATGWLADCISGADAEGGGGGSIYAGPVSSAKRSPTAPGSRMSHSPNRGSRVCRSRSTAMRPCGRGISRRSRPGAASLLSRPPRRGMRMALTALDLFRPTVGAATLGFARRAFDEALARSIGRTAFGKPIAQHQLIQQKLADMAVSIDAAALLVYRAAWLHDRGGGRSTQAAAIAKLFSTEAAQEVVDQALQIHGGMGVVSGVPVERRYREVRAFRIFDGTSEIQRLIIAKEALRAFAESTSES